MPGVWLQGAEHKAPGKLLQDTIQTCPENEGLGVHTQHHFHNGTRPQPGHQWASTLIFTMHPAGWNIYAGWGAIEADFYPLFRLFPLPKPPDNDKTTTKTVALLAPRYSLALLCILCIQHMLLELSMDWCTQSWLKKIVVKILCG